jgi:hypothetical protein
MVTSAFYVSIILKNKVNVSSLTLLLKYAEKGTGIETRD